MKIVFVKQCYDKRTGFFIYTNACNNIVWLVSERIVFEQLCTSRDVHHKMFTSDLPWRDSKAARQRQLMQGEPWVSVQKDKLLDHWESWKLTHTQIWQSIFLSSKVSSRAKTTGHISCRAYQGKHYSLLGEKKLCSSHYDPFKTKLHVCQNKANPVRSFKTKQNVQPKRL